MSFDDLIDRRNTLCAKWDNVGNFYNVDPDTCLPMWVADTDFRAPDVVQRALQGMVDHGVYAYMGDYGPYKTAIQWWMKNRHGWDIDQDWILTTFGVINGIGLALDAFTEPGDHIALFTPVYHAFAKIIRSAGRHVTELPLGMEDGKYIMDFDAAQAALTGKETMVFLCSPHNPAGRVWTRQELTDFAEFSVRNDMMILSDEIHHDLVFKGYKHIPTAHIDGIEDRLIVTTACSKTFNLAGMHTANVIISNPKLRETFNARMQALGIGTTMAGIYGATAAYSPEGAEWVDAQVAYIEANRAVFDAGVNAIPGIKAMPMESTFLSWVDFSGTGMTPEEFIGRVEQGAGIAANHGVTFGTGGESYLRFNLGTQRARIEDAVARLQQAFADLQ